MKGCTGPGYVWPTGSAVLTRRYPFTTSIKGTLLTSIGGACAVTAALAFWHPASMFIDLGDILCLFKGKHECTGPGRFCLF